MDKPVRVLAYQFRNHPRLSTIAGTETIAAGIAVHEICDLRIV